MELELTQIDGGITCVRLNGRMDSPGVDRIETKFTAALVAAGRNAVVDMSNVSFLASMGIRMFIASARALKLKGANMALFGANTMVQSVLDTVALDQIIPITDTQQHAVEKL